MFASALKFYQRTFLSKEIIFNFTRGKTLAFGQLNYPDQGVSLLTHTARKQLLRLG